jgi:hypothetical protein
MATPFVELSAEPRELPARIANEFQAFLQGI